MLWHAVLQLACAARLGSTHLYPAHAVLARYPTRPHHRGFAARLLNADTSAIESHFRQYIGVRSTSTLNISSRPSNIAIAQIHVCRSDKLW